MRAETDYERGRTAALAGRPVFANPHRGGESHGWFAGYRSVPEVERGSQPAPPPSRRVRKKQRGGFSKLHLQGSTSRPWGEL